jgi:4-amino-4-deoxy-L-arabinose transferase-like glycosyltransferase
MNNNNQTTLNYETQSKDRKDTLWVEFFLFAAAAFLLLWGLGSRNLWSSEGRWAEITREMFLSRDFFHPTIGGEPYFDKPLLTYWVIAAITAVSGRLDEFVIRLPSVIAALIALACTMYLGTRLWSRSVGRLAGGLLLTSFGFLMYSRVASAESENLAAIVLAVMWYWIRRDKPGFVSFLVFYLIMFIGSHMKGLTAFVVPVLVVLPDLLREKRWKWLFWPSHLVALIIGIAIYLTPFIYAEMTNPKGYQENGLFLAFQENIIRFVKPYDHKGPFYLYFGVVPLLTLPWIPLFIGAIMSSIKNWKKLSYNTRWLITSIVLIFVFFTISGSRRNYYILPILPFCMLLIAVFLTEKEFVLVNIVREIRNQKYFLFIFVIFELIFGPLAISILIYKYNWEMPYVLSLSFIIIGASALIPVAAFGILDKKFNLQPIWALIIMGGILLGGFFVWQFNIVDTTRTEQPFSLLLKTIASSYPHERVAFFETNPDKQLFYMKWNLPVTMLEDENELRTFLESGQPGLIIAQGRHVTNSVSAMLPSQADYIEASKAWDSSNSRNKKFRAWIINPNNEQIANQKRIDAYEE